MHSTNSPRIYEIQNFRSNAGNIWRYLETDHLKIKGKCSYLCALILCVHKSRNNLTGLLLSGSNKPCFSWIGRKSNFVQLISQLRYAAFDGDGVEFNKFVKWKWEGYCNFWVNHLLVQYISTRKEIHLWHLEWRCHLLNGIYEVW